MRRGWVAAVVIALALLVGARRCRSAKPEEPEARPPVRAIERVVARHPTADEAPRGRRQRAPEPSTQVRGRVVRADTRAPVAGAIVELRASASEVIEVTTDDAGRFEAGELLPRRYEVTAHAPGLAPVFTVEVQPDVGAPIDDVLCELVTAHRIEGRVVDSTGRGVAGAHVSLDANDARWDLVVDRISVETDLDGQFTLAQVPAGSYDVRASVRHAVTRPLEVMRDLADVVLELPSAEPRESFEAPPRVRGLLEGRIVDERGAPLAGAHITFTGPGRPSLGGSAEADDDGTFRVIGLDAPGTYTVRVYERLGTLQVLAPLQPLDEPAIVLPVPRTQLRGLVVRVADARVAITGRVVDEGGAPVAGIAVRATTVPHADGWPAITDATGAFEVRDLSPGRYWLRAVAPSGVAVHGPVEAGATDLRLVVARYGGIAGTLDGLPGAMVRVRGPQEGFEVTRVVSATADRFELRGLAAGTYEVHATGAESGGTALVTVEPGRVAELVVQPYVPAGDRPLPPPPPPP